MFVIYHAKNKFLMQTRNGSHFAMERTAKAVLTKAIKAGKAKEGEYIVASADDWHKADEMVTVTNILTGKEVQIRASERGGCCDPSTERYHCM